MNYNDKLNLILTGFNPDNHVDRFMYIWSKNGIVLSQNSRDILESIDLVVEMTTREMHNISRDIVSIIRNYTSQEDRLEGNISVDDILELIHTHFRFSPEDSDQIEQVAIDIASALPEHEADVHVEPRATGDRPADVDSPEQLAQTSRLANIGKIGDAEEEDLYTRLRDVPKISGKVDYTVRRGGERVVPSGRKRGDQFRRSYGHVRPGDPPLRKN